ncbi:Nif3-like dinuclear metal center hexameric protein [Paenibacillus sp. N4]|uniref:Nif3-like dinuclear metal center hexameric protein n=1 Tax=Paenibacillus vietnamensis TaxID=2590547 RepID=UPI001CD04A78|nr:Nif3-like dinuclear metal center hexameric protein [Paenibacillus vietnamensis]MCA0753563.1 Nif3-like dinuclear metal center hexameric protein [Paenibacillus vietnamensis]
MTLTIKQVIDRLRSSVQPIGDTVDVLAPGDPEAEVRGIATTFMATHQVIEQAVSMGVNLLISHEAPFYSHRMTEGLLTGDPVYGRKEQSLRESGIAIYRHHDYCHRLEPDIIMTGLLQRLKWESDVEEMLPTAAVLRLPERRLADIAAYVKEKLSIPYARIAGDPEMLCSRIGILVGYRGGGANAIPLYREKGLDLVICGEGPEWETPEYVRDSAWQGVSKSLIVIGHAESEEPGMRSLAHRLQEEYPEVPVHFIPVNPVFRVI